MYMNQRGCIRGCSLFDFQKDGFDLYVLLDGNKICLYEYKELLQIS